MLIDGIHGGQRHMKEIAVQNGRCVGHYRVLIKNEKIKDKYKQIIK
jgi:hypothetical protein